MKPLVLFHASCLDGFGAAFAAWLVLGDEAEYVACSYGKDFDPLIEIKDREVYILDFSFPRNIMDLFFTGAKRVVWLDHHKTAFEMWCDTEREYHCENSVGEIILDNNKSGALISWEYFHPGTEVPMLIKHIDDYDRWQFEIYGTKAFNKALWMSAPWTFVNWQAMFLPGTDWQGPAFVEMNYKRMLTEGSAILRAHDQNVQSVVKGSARGCRISCPGTCEEGLDYSKPYPWEWNTGGYFDIPGLSANCPPHLTSDVGHELANQSGTFGLCWTLSKEGLVAKCSLRSNGDYDVSAIASALGGGGHLQAAGFEVPIETLLSWLR